MARMTRKELTKSVNKGWAFEAQMSLLRKWKRDVNFLLSSPRQKESMPNTTALTALKQSSPKAFTRKCKSIALLSIG